MICPKCNSMMDMVSYKDITEVYGGIGHFHHRRQRKYRCNCGYEAKD